MWRISKVASLLLAVLTKISDDCGHSAVGPGADIPPSTETERERDTTIENYRILCGEVERWSLINTLRILGEMREILDFDYY